MHVVRKVAQHPVGVNVLETAQPHSSAVVPLIGGSLLLIAFLLWARWDGVFRDPAKLPVHGALRVPIAIFVVGIVVHLAIADWSSTSTTLLLAILAANDLVL